MSCTGGNSSTITLRSESISPALQLIRLTNSVPSLRQVVRAGTLRELAELFDLPADVLEEEVADYNRAVREGHDRFGRREFGEPLTAPFYGSLVTGALAQTQGGLRIDPTCRVLVGFARCFAEHVPTEPQFTPDAVTPTEHAGEAAAVKVDCLQDRLTFPNAHARPTSCATHRQSTVGHF
jgi:hypothetical protein